MKKCFSKKKFFGGVLTFLKYVLLCLTSFIAIAPLYAVAVTAFKTPQEYQTTNVMTLPSTLYLGNFRQAWEKAHMGLAFFNSMIVLVTVLVGFTLLSSMLAYVLSRFKFLGNGLIRNLFLFAALIPGVAMQVTVYNIMYQLNLINTLVGYIILMLGTDVVSVYIFIQYFNNLSISLDESAILDGCTYFGVFFKILLPLLRPAIITCMILKGVSTYNEYYMANLYLQDKQTLQVVSTSLYTFTGPLGSQYNLICAGVIIVTLPAVIAFVLFQKQIYSGLAAGAVKG